MQGFDVFAMLMGAFGVFWIGFSIGRAATKFPSESDMFKRLVDARARRKFDVATRENLNTAIDGEADKRAFAHN